MTTVYGMRDVPMTFAGVWAKEPTSWAIEVTAAEGVLDIAQLRKWARANIAVPIKHDLDTSSLPPGKYYLSRVRTRRMRNGHIRLRFDAIPATDVRNVSNP